MKGRIKTFIIGLASIFLMISLQALPLDITPDAMAASAADALKIKAQGDQYAREGNFPKAAEAYEEALSGKADFSDEDRLAMAMVLAWGGKLERSKLELLALVEKNSNDVKARVQLGRVLYWMGDIDGALIEADKARRLAPQDRDALLLAADIARLRGELEKAIALYQDILRKEEYFEARNALIYAHLASGNIAEAKRNFDLIAPALPYQREEQEKLRAAIAEAQKPGSPTPDDLARQAMERGNRLAEASQHQAASREYLTALSLSRSFTADEQFRMATVMSWAGSLREAKARLTKILDENPGMISARIHLARVLLWSGEFDAALREIDRVLSVESANREALLVRASGMRMKRNYQPAIVLYQSLIQEKDDYGAREGLTYAYLFSNDRVATDQSLPLLKPAFPYEEKSLGELKELRDVAFNPSLAPGFTFYSDSDKNEVWRLSATGSVWFGNWKTNLDYIHTSATDSSVSGSSDNIVVSTYSRMPFYGGIGGSIGLVDSGRNASWSVRADKDIPDGSIALRLAADTLSDTAAVIQNHIQVTTANLSGVYRPTDRITILGGYSYRDYSDENNAHDLTGRVSCLVLRKPAAVAAGYRFRYMNFKRQSRHGYFDPNNYLANLLFVNVSFERGRLYGYAEPYGGYETFKRNEEGNYNFVAGGAGMVGYRFSKHVALEAGAEGGNSAVGASGAYNYYQLGAKLILTY